MPHPVQLPVAVIVYMSDWSVVFLVTHVPVCSHVEGAFLRSVGEQREVELAQNHSNVQQLTFPDYDSPVGLRVNSPPDTCLRASVFKQMVSPSDAGGRGGGGEGHVLDNYWG